MDPSSDKTTDSKWAARWDTLNAVQKRYHDVQRQWRHSGAGFFELSAPERVARRQLRSELRIQRTEVEQQAEEFSAAAQQQSRDWGMSMESQLFLQKENENIPGYSATLIAAVSAWKQATGIDVRSLTPKDLQTIGAFANYPRDPERLRVALSHNPPDLLETAEDPLILASTDGWNDPATRARLDALRSVGLQPIAADVALVAKLPVEDFKSLKSFLERMSDIPPSVSRPQNVSNTI